MRTQHRRSLRLGGVHGKFVADVAARFLLHGLGGLQAIIFLPLIARSFGVAAYGVWTQIGLTASLAHPFVTLRLGRALVRYLGRLSAERERGAAYYSVVWMIWGGGAVLIGLAWPLQSTIGAFLFDDPTLGVYAPLVALLVAAEASLSIALAYFHSLGKLRLDTAIHIVARVGTIGAVGVTVLGLGGSLHSGVAAWVAVRVAAAAVAQGMVAHKEGFHLPTWPGVVRKFVRYSLPLVPAATAAWILEYSDRYIIVHMIGLKEAGVYAGSYQLAQVLRLIMMPISFALLPTMIQLWDNRETGQAFTLMRASLAGYATLSGWGGVMVISMGPMLLPILGTAPFDVSSGLLALLVFGEFSFALCLLLSQILYVHEQTRTAMFLAFIAASMNVGLNLLLIPHWGILGAAVATCASYTVQLGTTILAVRRLQRFDVPLHALLRILLAAGILHGVLRLSAIGGLGWTISGAVGGSLLYAAVLFSSRGIRDAVLRFLRPGGEA